MVLINAYFIGAGAFPLDFNSGLLEGQLAKLPDGMGFASGDDEIIGVILLEHEPHDFNIVRGVAPIAPCIQIPQIKFVLQAIPDPGHSTSDLTSDKGLTTAGRFVIEKDSITCK